MSDETSSSGSPSCITFDCYGTLIDWLGGLRRAAARAPSLAGADLERLLADRGRIELDLLGGPYRPYSEVLADSLTRATALQGRSLPLGEARTIAESQRRWPPFAESRGTLEQLATRFRLAILSNVETEVLHDSVRLLGAPFAALITAEELRSYKPATRHFEAALERLGVAREEVVHVAQSLDHDVRPALRLGWTVAWVNRLDGDLPRDLHPRWVVPDLRALEGKLG